jgi:integrase
MWRDKTETASRVRGRIESVLDWAAVRGYRKGENPARWRGQMQHVLPARRQIARPKHHPALAYAKLPQFLTALRERQGLAAKAMEFTILTAGRTGEVIGAKWDEIDFAAKIWTIGADRMKAGREHRVPLSDDALEILKSVPREDCNNNVFIGPRSGGLSNMAMAALLDRMNRNDITVHGFRSTFRDWAAEQTNYPNHVVEMALAHTVGNKVEAAYRRGDLFEKRQRLMVDWARFCRTKTATEGERIVILRKVAR